MQINSNRALWRTYIFVVSFSCIVAGAFLYLKWLDVKQTATLQQTYANKLIANSIENFLNKYEAFLELLGDKILELVASGELLKAQHEFDQLMLKNPELAALGFSDPDGKLLVLTSNLIHYQQNQTIINLKDYKPTHDSFMYAMQQKGLSMGRSYFMPNMEEWVIPLRHPVRNESDEVLGVLTIGLKLKQLNQIWFGDSLPEYLRYLMLREDLYRQYATFFADDEFEKMYMNPLPEARFDFLIGMMTQQTGHSLDDLKTGQLFASFEGPDISGGQNILTVSYNPKFRYYSVTGTHFDILSARMVSPTSWIILFLAIFNIGLFWLFRRNIRTQSSAKEVLHYQIEHDPLTQLPNRRFLVEHFSEWSDCQNGEFSLLYLDLKNFKVCNDIHGHSMGDQILCVVAERLKLFFEHCLCVRQGGDEFIILCPVTNDSAIRLRCQAFLKELEQTILIDHLSFSVHASIGVAIAPQDGATLDELLRKADMAMYEAKRRQQNVGLYSDELETRTKQMSEIEHELNHALQNNEFTVVYQPQVDAYSYQVLGIEALIRWNNSRLGFVPPDLFIPVAEANGLIHDIGHFVMATALRDAKEICQLSGFGHKLRVSVNVSVSQLFNDDFVTHMQDLLAQYSDQPITFMVEVTESLFIEDLLRAKEILLRAKAAGVYISLDDFGTGYSSLSVLSKLPINELKIDRSFVNDILTDEQDWLLAKSIINLCKSLSIPVVAEGVETKAQADRLAAHGCDVFQGYYFSRPLPKAELIEFLQTKGKGRYDYT
jgi:diguanylate cyclase (GGDEF)-like protein